MIETKRILVTGATGKVGQAFIRRLLSDPAYDSFEIRALCHNRMLDPGERLEVVRGSIDIGETVESIMAGVTHVLHLATCKETPDLIMDVAVKGLFGCSKPVGPVRPSANLSLSAGMPVWDTLSIPIRYPSPNSRSLRPIRAAMLCPKYSKR
jgi:uncharacterized protein YbjT (DUF2867 family)